MQNISTDPSVSLSAPVSIPCVVVGSYDQHVLESQKLCYSGKDALTFFNKVRGFFFHLSETHVLFHYSFSS